MPPTFFANVALQLCNRVFVVRFVISLERCNNSANQVDALLAIQQQAFNFYRGGLVSEDRKQHRVNQIQAIPDIVNAGVRIPLKVLEPKVVVSIQNVVDRLDDILVPNLPDKPLNLLQLVSIYLSNHPTPPKDDKAALGAATNFTA
ncbi:MAG: hypothetical protein HOQ01_13270 [Lysobacter sp.]|nr:hypothetical protein [Lysobacter sp.]